MMRIAIPLRLNSKQIAVVTPTPLKLGDRLIVPAEPTRVVDPDTKEELGALDYAIAWLTVIDAHPKFALCRIDTWNHWRGDLAPGMEVRLAEV